jgi:hypothetical protein
MLGFQPYETFQLLIDGGGVDRTNTLLIAACDAYVRRGKPTHPEIEQFETLALRLFPAAGPLARAKAAAILVRADLLSPALEGLIAEHIGDDLERWINTAASLSEKTMLDLIARQDSDIAAALARRADPTNIVLAKLFQMNSRKVYRALAANGAVSLRGAYLSALARSAHMDHIVAESLAARADFDAALLAPAFFDLADAGRIKVIRAFAGRATPAAPIKRTIEQISVANAELTRALMKLFSENRRPEVTRLLAQITGLDEVRQHGVAVPEIRYPHEHVTLAHQRTIARRFVELANQGAKEIGFARPYTPDFLGWFDDFSTTGGGFDALGTMGRGHISFAENLGGPIRKYQYKRCPGAAEAPAADGSNVWSEEQMAEWQCEESARATGDVR